MSLSPKKGRKLCKDFAEILSGVMAVGVHRRVIEVGDHAICNRSGKGHLSSLREKVGDPHEEGLTTVWESKEHPAYVLLRGLCWPSQWLHRWQHSSSQKTGGAVFHQVPSSSFFPARRISWPSGTSAGEFEVPVPASAGCLDSTSHHDISQG